MADLKIDTYIPFGQYELIRRIGAGGMGEVFLARQRFGGEYRACVIKKVLPHLLENKSFVGRFRDEAALAARLQHTNIARVYEMGEVNGEFFLSMEYVQGKTVSRLTRRLKERNRVLPAGLALYIAERVCDGLNYAHQVLDEHGQPLHLVHRDLSPANVCVGYDGEVKIIDFGAAYSTVKLEKTAPRIVIGNLAYMAPEQARKHAVDGRADVYSCGAMLWELLTWVLLPQKGDPLERWRRAAHPRWEPPSVHQPALRRDIDDVVLRALEADASRRYSSALEFGEALRTLRLRLAPNAEKELLGEWVASAFSAEHASEQSALALALGPARRSTRSEKVATSNIAPPTALAFEHTATLALDELQDEERTQVGGRPLPPPPEATPGPVSSELSTSQRLRPTRTAFDMPLNPQPRKRRSEVRSFIAEIEATVDESLPEAESGSGSALGNLVVWGVLVFLAALAGGFGLTWAVRGH